MNDMNRVIAAFVKYLPDIYLICVASILLLVLFIVLILYLANERRILLKLLRENIESNEQQCDYLEWLQNNKDQLSKMVLHLNNSSEKTVAASEVMIAKLVEEGKVYLERACAAEKKCVGLQSIITKFSEKEKEISQLQASNREYCHDMNELEQQVKELTKQLKSTQQKLAERKEIQQITETNEYKKLQAKCESRDFQLKIMQEEKDRLQAENDRLQEKTFSLQVEIEKLEDQLAAYRDKWDGICVIGEDPFSTDPDIVFEGHLNNVRTE